ncbi:hypothetical protein OA07_26785 [Aphanizomenon flos-aquae 2012/KM1/D3]|nr:hypothetical protein OA07_26785 [Aphanizomenon flos-aquae 2012/KM1/D3]
MINLRFHKLAIAFKINGDYLVTNFPNLTYFENPIMPLLMILIEKWRAIPTECYANALFALE